MPFAVTISICSFFLDVAFNGCFTHGITSRSYLLCLQHICLVVQELYQSEREKREEAERLLEEARYKEEQPSEVLVLLKIPY